MKAGNDQVWGVVALMAGIGMLLIGAGVIPVEARRGDSPIALLLFGFSLSAAGLSLIVRRYPRIRLGVTGRPLASKDL